MTTLTVTRRAAIARGACRDAHYWSAEWLAENGGDDDTPILLTVVLDSPGGLDWALWAMRCAEPVTDRDRIARLFAADCAERVVALADDPRATEAITVARRYATGGATGGELAVAGAAAWDASRVAAWNISWIARAAASAASAAAGADVWDAAHGASWAAARAAAGNPDDGEAARDTEVAWQTDRLRLYLTGAELPPVEPVGVGDAGGAA